MLLFRVSRFWPLVHGYMYLVGALEHAACGLWGVPHYNTTHVVTHVVTTVSMSN